MMMVWYVVEEADEPFIVKSYSNYSFRHQQSIKSNQLGLQSLQSELLRIQIIVSDGIKSLGGNYSRDKKKTWENAVKNAETLSELKDLLIQLEEVIHENQTQEDKKEEDEIKKEKDLLRESLRKEGWNFDVDVNEFLGRKVRRFFPGNLISN